jgi:hypothetical protein
MIETHVCDKIYVFSPPSSRMLRDCTHAVRVDCILMSKGHYVFSYAVIDAL